MASWMTAGRTSALVAAMMMACAGTGCGSVVVQETDAGGSTGAAGSSGVGGSGGVSPWSCDEPPPATSEHLFSQIYGGGVRQRTAQLVPTQDGHALAVGDFDGTLTFDPSLPPTPPEDSDAFVAKVGADGSVVWTRTFGGPAWQLGQAIAEDSAQNVLVTGYYQDGEMDFGSGVVLPAGPHARGYVAKLTPSGEVLWARTFPGGDGYTAVSGLAVGADDALYIVGNFNADIDTGAGAFVTKGEVDGFLVKLDPAGNPLWSRNLGGPWFDYFGGAAPLGDGVAVAGQFHYDMEYEGGALSGTSDEGVVLAFDGAGEPVFARQLSGLGDEGARSITATPSGHLIVTAFLFGNPPSSIDPGTGPLYGIGFADSLVLDLDPTGAVTWAKLFGAQQSETFLTHAAVDCAGRLHLTGTANGGADFGGGPLAAVGEDDLVVATLDAAGNHLASRRLGSASNDAPGGIAPLGVSAVMVAGSVRGPANLGGGTLPFTDAQDVFLLTLSP